MVPPTPRDSVTVTEGGTEYGGDEDTEMRDVSPGTFTTAQGNPLELPLDPSPTSPRGTRKKPPKKTAPVGRPRGGAAGGRATKKKKK
jgi:hypothetical protein